MCNTVFMEGSETDPKPIPKTGTGWKIFYVKFGRLLPAYHRGFGYRLDSEGWAHFDKAFGKGDAFCFFLDQKTAMINLLDLDEMENFLGGRGRFEIRQIEYKGGIQARLEPGVIGLNFRIAVIGLATSFRILNS